MASTGPATRLCQVLTPRCKGITRDVKADKSRQKGGPPSPKGAILERGKGRDTCKGVCYAYQKGNLHGGKRVRLRCTRGKECAYAHVKEISSPNTAGKAAGGAELLAGSLGTCEFGASCKDRHGSAGKGKSKGTRTGTIPAAVTGAVAVTICEGGGELQREHVGDISACD